MLVHLHYKSTNRGNNDTNSPVRDVKVVKGTGYTVLIIPDGKDRFEVSIDDQDRNNYCLEEAVRQCISEFGVPSSVYAANEANYQKVGRVLEECGYRLQKPLFSAFSGEMRMVKPDAAKTPAR